MDSNSNQAIDPQKYDELQKQYNELQTKFEKKKVIYNKINKGLKVISSYLNKKKKMEQEKKLKKDNKKKLSNDYTQYNFSEADYETTTNNETPNRNVNDNSNSTHLNVDDSNLFEPSAIKVKFDNTDKKEHLHKAFNKTTNHKKHVKVSSLNDYTNQDINKDILMTNENDLMKLLDNEDMLNLKELNELNRLISDGYTLDESVQPSQSADMGKYCESCEDYVISEGDDCMDFSTDEDWDSSDSDDSLDISVSGMSGFSGLSGLSNNNKAEYYSDGYQSDDESSGQDNDNMLPLESTTSNTFKNNKLDDNLVLLKGRKSIQFDKKEELSNQMKIQQHKVEKYKKMGKKVTKSKSLDNDNDDFSMSDSSLPISRINTQNTSNSQMISDVEMNKDENGISKEPLNNERHSKVAKKENGKRLKRTGKDDQYDAIKELHRKAIRMYKRKLMKKRQRMLERASEGGTKDLKKNTKLKPIREVLGDGVPLDMKKVTPSLPNVNAIESHPAQSGFMQYMFMNNVVQTPYKDNPMFYGGMVQNNSHNTPLMTMETPTMNTASPLNDPNSVLNYKPMNPIAVSPKYSNVRLTLGNGTGVKRPSLPSSSLSFNTLANNETPTLEITSPNESTNGNNMNKVIQQFANVYIEQGGTNDEDKAPKPKKKYVKVVINIPDEFKDKEIITEEEFFDIFGLRIPEKTKSAVDIWNQHHQVNERGHSFEKLNNEFGTKWKIKCEPKFIKKYNRRHVIIKAVKNYMKRNNTDDPYECLNRLDNYLIEKNKPISYLFIRHNLPPWL